MHNRSRISPVLSPYTLLTLVLAFVFGILGQIQSVQAAPALGTQYQYFMIARVIPSQSMICPGDIIIITAKVQRAQVNVANPWDTAQDTPGVTVKGTVANAAIGKLSEGGKVTGWNSAYPGTADFYFTAKKAGTTQITFEGQVNHIWWVGKLFGTSKIVDRRDFVSDSVTVKVEDCDLKVSAVSQWYVEGPANMNFTANIDQTALAADDSGHYTGSGNVSWVVSSSSVGDCSGNLKASTSKVELSGDLNAETGLITVKMTYDSSTAEMTSNCGNWQLPIRPDPVQFVTTTEGGVSTQVHVLRGPANMNGSIQVDIVPPG